MANIGTDKVLVEMVSSYLMSHGEASMTSALKEHVSKFVEVANITNKLQWDNFVEGMISK